MQQHEEFRGSPMDHHDLPLDLEDSGPSESMDDLLGLLPRHLLASPTVDLEEGSGDCNGAANSEAKAPSNARQDAPAHRGADNDRGCSLSQPAAAASLGFAQSGKVLPATLSPRVQHGAGAGSGMSIETERIVAYLTQRGKAALAAQERAMQDGERTTALFGADACWAATPSAAGERRSSIPGTEGFASSELQQCATPPLFASVSHVASLPAFLQPDPMLPAASAPPWGGSGSTAVPAPPATATTATSRLPWARQPVFSQACSLNPAAAACHEDLGRRLGLPPPPPPGSALAAMAAAAWGWAAATRRGSSSGGVAEQQVLGGVTGGSGGGCFTPLTQQTSASAPTPPFLLAPMAATTMSSPFCGGAAGASGPTVGLGGGGGGGAHQPAALISKHLWCGNVMVADADTLARTFSPFGPLDSVRVFAGRTYAFVNFMFAEHAAAAKAALEMQVLPELTSAAPLLVRFQLPPDSLDARRTLASGPTDMQPF